MKKLSIALFALFAAAPAFSAAVTIGAGVASLDTGSQNVTVTNGSGLKFQSFDVTISKGVSLFTTDDTGTVAVGVNSKHKASDKVFGGSSQGGSVAQCGTTGTKNADLAAAKDDSSCNTTGS
jgi:hypothetical protein